MSILICDSCNEAQFEEDCKRRVEDGDVWLACWYCGEEDLVESYDCNTCGDACKAEEIVEDDCIACTKANELLELEEERICAQIQAATDGETS